ncbi:MAG: replication restart helicase PriA, partial [Halothermotrichaceae bacterium]
MNKYVEVIVDIPIAKFDRTYTYTVPDYLNNKIKVGHAVRVPFGKRIVPGFVISFTEKPDLELNKIKKIKELIIKKALFDEDMLKLFKWISSYYKSYLVKVIKTAVPTGLITGKVKKRKIKIVDLNKSKDEVNKFINNNERAYKQVEILKILLSSNNKEFSIAKLAKKADTSHSTIKRLADKGYVTYREKLIKRRPLLIQDELESQEEPLIPTSAQKEIISEISDSVDKNSSEVYLLHGVTGSGKTEVYLQVIQKALNCGQSAIVLVPEISLTPMMVNRFYRRFGDQIAVLHSNLSLGERYDEWCRIKKGDARIVIGARSAVFAPINNPGLIVIDEEHENSYKQGESPYYHAREVALKRGKISQSTVVLGSATPSFESYYFAKKGNFKYLHLPERINKKDLPMVKIIDMREELEKGNTTIFSKPLSQAIDKALNKGEQVLIFLNRRGYANFILCRECGYVIRCRHCDISLTYHINDSKLRCHYCDYSLTLPKKCPECGSSYIREFGVGTERIEKELAKMYPDARIDRMDVDTTTRKGSHQRILEKLEKGDTDILVGTQMIAKGHDYPNISVVGVITADTILNIPDFRSAERTFQLLTQVAGRTGRGSKQGRVFIQTYTPDHYSIESAQKHDYNGFYKQEIISRKKLNYPPFSQLVNIIIQGRKEKHVINGAQNLGIFLDNF